MTDHTKRLQAGLALQQAARFTAAEQIYRSVLDVDSGNPDALHLLGLILLQRGELAAATDLVARAADAAPATAIYHNSLGECYRMGGEAEAAITAYRRAIAADPGYAEPLSNLSLLLRDQGLIDEAVAALRQAIAIKPDYAEAHNNLGVNLYDIEAFEEAVAAYRLALRLNPALISAYSNMGNALRKLGRLDEAIAAYREAIARDPDHADAHSNLGTVLQQQRRLDEAIASYRRALAIDPDLADAHNNLGAALFEAGAPGEAREAIRRAIAHKPDYAEAHNNLGNVLFQFGRAGEALDHIERSLDIDPDYDTAYFNLVSHLPVIGDWERQARYLKELRPRLDAALARGNETALASLVPLSFTLPYFSSDTAMHLDAVRAVAEYTSILSERLAPGMRFAAPDHTSRLKIGYVSPDFGDHPISHVTLPVYGLHDRARFEVTCYSLLDRAGETSGYLNEIQHAADHFVDLAATSFVDTARRIADDGIHILVDLTGYMRHSRPQTFAMRPAPVQVYWLGHGGSLGAPYMDYVIGDPWVTPLAEDGTYTEKIARLPDTFSSADRAPISDAPQRRAEYGLPEHAVVFVAFNNALKIERSCFAVWMKILAAVPDSVLWLSGGGNADLRANLSRVAAAGGIDPARLVFAGRVADKATHLARHRLADLFLDTFKFNASTTALDALWAGLPIVTLAGDNFTSRIGASYLNALGLPQLVAADAAAYRDMAVALALDGSRRQDLKHRLDGLRLTSPLFDPARFTRHLESAYERMWHRFETGAGPESFDVPAI
ncbi:MAG: tetratricopeptide repeat protein [Alphaproteobacteria bacterium]|jgi:predicted O-linked N-acetylglucosamine transferase (SPINDLY family)|nr:tetratricopeptide repeat protein [Alphaproteobacteria bacterium]MDP6515830.1 tetratricopeptide repeat protein [Alphaproteobacteria bacterium]